MSVPPSGIRPSFRLHVAGALVLILIAGTAHAQPSTTKIVPIVLDVTGSGEHFTTELVLANRGTTAASVALTYTPATALGASGGGSTSVALAAGQQLVVPDVVAYLRGQGLAIPTGSNQGGSVLAVFTGLSSPDAAYVVARTTTPSGPGRAGLAYPGVDLVSAQTGTSYLYGLRSTPSDRSNLALVNAGTASVTLRVTLYSGVAGDGRTFVLTPDTTLAAGQWTQVSRVLDLAGFTNGYARVDLLSGTGSYVAYAVINDNTTNDGSYVSAEPFGMPAEMRLLPVLVESAAYQSELVLTNPSATAQTAVLSYVESASPAGGAGGTVTLSLQPGEQKIIPGAIDYLRANHISIGPKGSATFAGALSVTFKSGTSVSSGFVGARTAAPVDGTGPGEYGLFYPGVGPSFAALNEAWVYGLAQDAGDRSNLAVANLGDAGDPISFRVDVYNGSTGQLTGSTSAATLAPGGWMQVNAILQSFGVSNGYAHVVKLTGNSRFFAYGVVNDGGAPGQGTSDGSYVAGQVLPAPAVLTWIPASTVKLEQVIGDCDLQAQAGQIVARQTVTCVPTTSRTITRFNIAGNGQGGSFEAGDGRMIFFFGDTISSNVSTVNYHAGDPVAWSTSTDPEAGLLLNFYTETNGSPLFVKPPGIAMGGDDIPNSGISLNGQIFFIVNTGSDPSLDNPQGGDSSVLVQFDEAAQTFTAGRTISPAGGRFIGTALCASGSSVYMFGAGPYRASDIYLQAVPASSFASGAGTQYFAGLVNGQPTWTNSESGAVPVVQDNPLNGPAWPNDTPTVGNLSVVFSRDLNLWLLTYDGGRQSNKTRGDYFTYAPQPWGPWATPQLILNDARDHAYGLGGFVHNPNVVPDPPGDGLNGPTIGSNDIYTTSGGTFAPLMIGRFLTVAGNMLKVYYNVSTWNPYVIVRMRSEFAITRAP